MYFPFMRFRLFAIFFCVLVLHAQTPGNAYYESCLNSVRPASEVRNT